MNKFLFPKVGEQANDGNLLVAGAVGLLAGKTTFLATSTFALLRLMADSSPCSNPI